MAVCNARISLPTPRRLAGIVEVCRTRNPFLRFLSPYSLLLLLLLLPLRRFFFVFFFFFLHFVRSHPTLVQYTLRTFLLGSFERRRRGDTIGTQDGEGFDREKLDGSAINQSSRCRRSFLSPISLRVCCERAKRAKRNEEKERERERERVSETKEKEREGGKARNGGRLSEQEFDNYVTGT